MQRGRYAEAEPMLQRTRVMCEQVLGPDHPDVATNLNNLASLYRGQGKYAEAESYARDALEMYKRSSGLREADMPVKSAILSANASFIPIFCKVSPRE